LRRSIKVTRTGALANCRAAVNPPNPPPKITTWGVRSLVAAFVATLQNHLSRKASLPLSGVCRLPHGRKAAPRLQSSVCRVATVAPVRCFSLELVDFLVV